MAAADDQRKFGSREPVGERGSSHSVNNRAESRILVVALVGCDDVDASIDTKPSALYKCSSSSFAVNASYICATGTPIVSGVSNVNMSAIPAIGKINNSNKLKSTSNKVETHEICVNYTLPVAANSLFNGQICEQKKEITQVDADGAHIRG